MKNLSDYISESFNEKRIIESEEKTFEFNFDGLENAEDTLNSLKENDECTVEDNKLTVKVTANNVDKLETIQDILQQYADTIRKSTKTTNDEMYAQKTSKFAKKVGEFNDAIDSIKNPEEE